LKPGLIKWIDRRIGVLVCRLLSFISFLLPQRRTDSKTEKVLFIKLIEQGASVLAYSALQEAVKKVGKENVYFLVFKENRPILDLLNVLEPKNIIEINNDNLFGFAIDILKSLFLIRKSKIDSCIDMEFFSRASVIIAFLCGAKKRVGLFSFTSEHPYRGSLITHKIHYNPYVHVSQYYLMLVKALDEKPVHEPLLKKAISSYQTQLPRVKISKEVENSLIRKINLPDEFDKLIVLNPNASDMLPLRKWDSDNFKTITLQLRDSFPRAVIVFTGVLEEKNKIDELVSDLNDPFLINSAGKTTLMELMALYQLSDLVLTNDSGPAHFASMFDTQVIVLFGPETPDLFAPKGDQIHVIYKKLACSPCVNVFNHRFSPCKDNVCMQEITAKEVFTKIKEIL
jgi:ADP-heptose:LPS heptosyltransferase